VAVPTPFCKLFIMALDDFMLKVLIVSAILSLTLEMIFAKPEDRNTGKYLSIWAGGSSPPFSILSIIIICLTYYIIAWIEGFAILLAVFVVSMVTAVNDYQKEKQFLALQAVGDAKKYVRKIQIP
jgi:magnesium-transporting ATPase (P-type)